MSDDLAKFLLARIAEDEQIARGARALRWYHDGRAGPHDIASPYCTVIRSAGSFSHVQDNHVCGSVLVSDAAHITRHNPARVLARCAADRRIVELHELDVKKDPVMFDRYSGERIGPTFEVTCAVCGWASDDPTSACETLRLLALPYEDHPEYREEWRP